MPPRKKRSAASSVKVPPPKRTLSAAVPGRPAAGAIRQLSGTTSQPVTPAKRTTGSRRTSSRLASNIVATEHIERSPEVIDSADALYPSPDAKGYWSSPPNGGKASESKPSDPSEPVAEAASKKRKVNSTAGKERQLGGPRTAVGDAIVGDPELAEDEGVTPEELQETLGRPPPVNSGYLPLPWKGRLGYACLNTYLRTSNPPVFSSRTCRIASIIEHRYPLADPSQPEHPTKNRPDRDRPASVERGQRYVEAIGLANARDIIKMVRWNDRYNIKFMRLSSEIFPFASHEEYGYKLAPFASEVLAEVGEVIAKLGHRVTTHPGQFTQLGSPRKVVVDNAIRDLEYHDEMLSLLKLPEQLDKDAVMILHMGGVFGDKDATLDRFRQNFAKLSESVKRRLVLENDDVSWSVHNLLPICQELNIPFVLDYHHHNIVFDNTKIREGTLDITSLYEEIAGTWKRKGITQKMHYSEPTAPAVTPRQRRKHAARVMTLPPCDPTMDLMIEAKDKEQAVLELMRTFKLPGSDTFTDIIPHQRGDESKPARPPKKKSKKAMKAEEENGIEPDVGTPAVVVSEEDTGMGGPDGRVYWPPGMEEWLRPPKRGTKKNGERDNTPAKKQAARRVNGNKGGVADEYEAATEAKDAENREQDTPARMSLPKKTARRKTGSAAPVPNSSTSEDSGLSDVPSDFSAEEIMSAGKRAGKKDGRQASTLSRRSSRRISGVRGEIAATHAV